MWDIKYLIFVGGLRKALVGEKKFKQELGTYIPVERSITHFSACQMYLPEICLTKSRISEVSFLTADLCFSCVMPNLLAYTLLVLIDYPSKLEVKEIEATSSHCV